MSTDDLKLLRQAKEVYGAEFEKHLFEQYKLYVEMADRISGRRMLANSFFVGVYTALITTFTVLLKEKVLLPTLVGLAPFLAVILLCFVWWRVVYSYRQLNFRKLEVVYILLQELTPHSRGRATVIKSKDLDNFREYFRSAKSVF